MARRESLCQDASPAPAVGRVFLCADDGNESDLWLADELALRGLPGSLFVHTALVGSQGKLSWAEIESLGQHMDVCSHGAMGGFYTQLSDEELAQYLRSARLELEAHGRGLDALVFGPPNDDIDARVRKYAIDAGYRVIRTKKREHWLLPGLSEFAMFGVSYKRPTQFYVDWLDWCASGPPSRGLALVFHRIEPDSPNPAPATCDRRLARWLMDLVADSPCSAIRFRDLLAAAGNEATCGPGCQAALPLAYVGRGE